ncbi:hypothetical protein V6N13_108025 [Hibiscus sabdariffa]
MPQHVDATLTVLREESNCLQLENESNIDDEDDTKHEELFMNVVSDLLPTFAKSISCHFAHVFTKLFEPLMKFLTASRPPQDRTMVVACIAEIAQGMSDPIEGCVDRLMPLVLKELASSSTTNRRNVAFFVEELTKNGRESALEESLKILKRHFGYFHEDVRLQVIIALEHILTVTLTIFQCQNDGLMKAREMHDIVMNIYIKTVIEDDDKVEKVVVSNRVDDFPCYSMIGEYGRTTNMEGLMKAQALKDNNIAGTATTFSSTAKSKSGVGEAIRRDFMGINSMARLSREATHLNNLIYNFRRWRDVSFPKFVHPLVHCIVLVETYEQWESVAYYVDDLKGHDRIKG